MSEQAGNKGLTYHDLIKMKARELDQIFQRGVTPKPEDLIGWEFRGFNPPTFARVLGFQKFKKGFFVDAGQSKDADVSGYNVWVFQNRADDPHVAKPTEEVPKRHGFFLVHKVEAGDADGKYPHALLLDYGKGKNSPYNPERAIRDYLVQVDPDNRDLYLGKAYLAVGGLRIFSNFFVIERYNQANIKPM